MVRWLVISEAVTEATSSGSGITNTLAAQRRAELIAWKRDRAGSPVETQEQKRQRLLREKRRLMEELQRIEVELADGG